MSPKRYSITDWYGTANCGRSRLREVHEELHDAMVLGRQDAGEAGVGDVPVGEGDGHRPADLDARGGSACAELDGDGLGRAVHGELARDVDGRRDVVGGNRRQLDGLRQL